MSNFLAEQDALMTKILGDYGNLIRGAVFKATRGQPGGDDVVSEVYFAVLLTLRKYGTGWTPPRSFIFAVIRNKVNDFLRQKYRDRDRLEALKSRLEIQSRQRDEVVSRIPSLTSAEFRAFRQLGLGMTNSEIAAGLHISLHTVRSHMKKIHAKCGIKDRAKLTLIAYLICYREHADKPAAVEDCRETPAAGAVAADPRGRRQPELWDQGLPDAPVAIGKTAGYVS